MACARNHAVSQLDRQNSVIDYQCYSTNMTQLSQSYIENKT
jgi:hypothetical protein